MSQANVSKRVSASAVGGDADGGICDLHILRIGLLCPVRGWRLPKRAAALGRPGRVRADATEPFPFFPESSL